MKKFAFLPLCFLFALSACTQSPTSGANKPSPGDMNVGASCEGCEAIFECPLPFDQLNAIDTLPDFNNEGPKLYVSGIIYQKDGKTPAPNVVLYFYHTDQRGVYPTKGNEAGWGKRHGYLRGWVKTGKDGKYGFYTLVPASYPNSTNPKHIHPIIKEPGKTAYWIDEYLFEDDPLLPDQDKNRKNPVGGSGILKTTNEHGMLVAKRNIILGLNVKGYPK